MTTPAQRLRDAARGMRENAEAATPGPWHWYVRGDRRWAIVEERATDERRAAARCSDDDDAAYIAAMSPPVALALADLLDVAGTTMSAEGPHEHHEFAALAVADAFLGWKHE